MNKKMIEEMTEKEILRRQLELLAEASEKETNPLILTCLSSEMLKIEHRLWIV